MNCPQYFPKPEEKKPCLRSRALSETAGEYPNMVDGKPGKREAWPCQVPSFRWGK